MGFSGKLGPTFPALQQFHNRNIISEKLFRTARIGRLDDLSSLETLWISSSLSSSHPNIERRLKSDPFKSMHLWVFQRDQKCLSHLREMFNLSNIGPDGAK